LSRVAEEALAHALALRLAKQTRADIQHDLRAHDAFVEALAEMVRNHYATADGDAPV
jgi:hypothetical protein